MIFISVSIFVFLCIMSSDATESIVPLNTHTKSNHYTMVKDYTLNLDILNSESHLDTSIPSLSLNIYKKDPDSNPVWIQGITDFFTRPDTLIQKEVDSLNRVIINANNGLLNMCDKMIEKTTSVLPLSYSFYSKFETEFLANDLSKADSNGGSGFFNFFSPSTKEDLNIADSDLGQQMYDYHVYRLAINNRQAFLNSLCFATFADPYTLYYNSVNNTIVFAFDPTPIRYYAIVVQNIIDNSYIRGFKGVKKGKGLQFDLESDNKDKEKKTALVEKAKYILPILQKLEQRLPSYLSIIAKRSLSVDEYFVNLRQFWTDILNEANIAAHDSPSKYEAELLQERLKQQVKEDALKKAQLDADRIIQEFKNKQLLTDAENYVREQNIIQKDIKQNYSIVEWDQLKRRIRLHVSGFTGSLVSGIDGVIKVPVDYILGFASNTIWDLAKIAIMLLILVSICLRVYNKIVSMFFLKNDVKEVKM